MKRRIIFAAIFWVNIILSLENLYAFENVKTHPAVTERASIASTIDNYLKTQLGLNDGINAQLSYNFPSEIQKRIERAQGLPEETNRPILEWLKVGSAIEDTDNTWYYKPIRPRHHFYDPTRNAGLDNKTGHPEWRSYAPAKGTRYDFDFTGESALTWAVDGTASQKPTANNQAWQSSRADFYNSVTKPLKSDREKYLAMTFLDLGGVLHMIEDMGVPAHTRNDFLFAHYRKYNDYSEPLERWIEIMIPSGGSLERWISGGWTPTPQVFSKVSNYFDADLYTGNYLGDGVPTPGNWGLSERTNYQFLSWTTIFNGDFLNSLYYFPQPAKMHTIEVNESGRIYLSGYDVNHLARQTMSYHHFKHDHLDKSWCVLGETIYDDYAKITIPRTIDYATGLANYFFRGRLSVSLNYLTCENIRLNITNESKNSGINQSLKGGVFELYWDEPNGNRTEVAEFIAFDSNSPADNDVWSSNCTLPYGQSIRAEFPKPIGAVEKLILVYKGNISQNTSEPDSGDSDALAVAIISNPGCPFSADDCGCFLDPNTPDWNGSTVYNKKNLVEYGGATYESNADNNINHIPSSSPAWWTKVSNAISSGNPNWNDYSPFGGIGKTPKYLKVTFSNVSTNPGDQCLDECEQVDCYTNKDKFNPNRSFILTHSGRCSWGCGCSEYPGWNVSVDLGGFINLLLRLYEGDCGASCCCQYFSAGESNCGVSGDEHMWDMGGFRESHEYGYGYYPYTYAGEWNSITNYPLNASAYGRPFDIVTYNGVVYRCLSANNLNHNPASSPTWWTTELDTVIFETGNIVANGYRCIQAHQTSPLNQPGVGVDWEEYWEVFNCFDTFEKTIKNFCVLCNNGEYEASDYKPRDGIATVEILPNLISTSLSKATNPNPENDATDVLLTPTLSWTPDEHATYHKIYFGTLNPPPLVARVSGDIFAYNLGTLQRNTTYYWRIDSGIDECVIGTNLVQGNVWKFTTIETLPDTIPPTPNPSTWVMGLEPVYEGGKHKMTATTATDSESPPVYYQFEHVSGGGSSSDWQESPYYECAASSYGSYKVRTKDALGNIGSYSQTYHTLFGYQ